MAAAVPTVEPVSLYAGDSIHFTRSIQDYPASTWTLAYRILSQKAQADIDITAVADGDDFEVTVASATTATWTDGDYTMFGYVTSGTERVQVYQGKLTVLPNPASVDHFDGRTYWQLVLAKLQSVLLNGVIRAPIRFAYGGVTTEVQKLEDVLDAIARVESIIAQEEAVATGKQRRILTKFVTPR